MNVTSQIQTLRTQIGETADSLAYIASAEGQTDGQVRTMKRIGAHLALAGILVQQLGSDNVLTFSPEETTTARKGMSVELVRLLGQGMHVRLLEQTSGEGADGEEHVYPIGTVGEVSSVSRLSAPQGVAVTVIIGPQDGDKAIVNVFDEGDEWFPLELIRA